jgi:hypothetical protein
MEVTSRLKSNGRVFPSDLYLSLLLQGCLVESQVDRQAEQPSNLAAFLSPMLMNILPCYAWGLHNLYPPLETFVY